MRFDRFLSVYLFACLARLARKQTQSTLPILMYHSISDKPEDGTAPYYRTVTSPTVFRSQMAWLRANHYQSLTMPQALQLLEQKASCSGKYFVVTFDDGFRDVHACAAPILREFGFTASVFVATGYIQNPRAHFDHTECMVWGEIAALHRQGFCIGSHTVTHPRLVTLSAAEVEAELRESRKTLENQLQCPVEHFCHPYAFPQGSRSYVEGFRKIAAGLGYKSCVTTRIGRARAGDDPFSLRRLPVNSCDDLTLFRAKLEGGYDWLGLPQKHLTNCIQKIRARKSPRALSPG